MTTPETATLEAGDRLPSPEEAKAILHQLAGPYLRTTGPEKPCVGAAAPSDSTVRRDISRFKTIESLSCRIPLSSPTRTA